MIMRIIGKVMRSVSVFTTALIDVASSILSLFGGLLLAYPSLLIIFFLLLLPFSLLEGFGPTLWDFFWENPFQEYDLNIANVGRYIFFFWFQASIIGFYIWGYRKLSLKMLGKKRYRIASLGKISDSFLWAPGVLTGVYSVLILPAIGINRWALVTLSILLVLSGTIPVFVSIKNYLNNNLRISEMRFQFALLSLALCLLPGIFGWINHGLWGLTVGQVLIPQGLVYEQSMLQIPLKLLSESAITASAITVILAWQMPIVAQSRLVGVFLTLIIAASEPISGLFKNLRSYLLQEALGWFIYIPEIVIRVIVYGLVFFVLKGIYSYMIKRIEKTRKCNYCGVRHHPEAHYCSNCGNAL